MRISAPLKPQRMALASLLLTTALSGQSAAREDGTLIPNCDGCHYGRGNIAVPKLELAEDLVSIPLGQESTIPVSLRSARANAFGVLVQSKETVFSSLPEISPNEVGMGHTQPLMATDGTLDFDVVISAPDTPGVTTIDVSAVAADANGNPEDDTFGSGRLDVVYGCEPLVSYPDADGDGFGDPAGRFVSCTEIRGVQVGGDCDDSSPTVYPGAPELCNFIDDNCDGDLDEGLNLDFHYRDADGDGFGLRGTQEFTCEAPQLATNDDDCDDERLESFPGAQEVCNGIDDDCDGLVDEECVEPGASSCTMSTEFPRRTHMHPTSLLAAAVILLASFRRRKKNI